jgi:hypothetical protein
VGEYHPAASDTDTEPDANSHAVTLDLADRFTKPCAVARQLAGSIARADVRVPAAVAERFAVSRSIAEAEPDSFRKRVAVAVAIAKILRLAQNEAQQLAF